VEMPEIGAGVKFRPAVFGTEVHGGGFMSFPSSVRGIVCYVNRPHRWYLVEWITPAGVPLREAVKC